MAKDRERRIPSAAGLAISLLPFAPGRAGATAERAAAITPARGLRELDQQQLQQLPLRTGGGLGTEGDTSKSDMGWTQIGFASPTPQMRANSGSPPPPAPSIASPETNPSLITGGALVPIDRGSLDEPAASGPWQPKTSAVVITAGLLICAVAVMAVLRATPPPRAPGSTMTVVTPTATAVATPAPGASTASELVVRVTPPTAQILIDGALVAGNPFRGRFPGGIHQIQAFAAGYDPKVQQASLATDVVVELSLDRRTRGTPPTVAGRAAHTPPLGQGERPQQSRSPSSARPTTGVIAPGTAPPPISAPAIPGLLTPDVVDPRGGRSPMHPIEIRSPYKNP